MRVLVIGRSGQLGRSLVEAELPPSISLSAVGRPDCDVSDPASVARLIDRINPALVINAAGYTAVDRAETEEAQAFAINADGPVNVGSVCAGLGVPVIHISTDYVYDGTKASPYVESDPVGPINVYGRSKLAGEQRLAEAQPKHIILRTAWVYSPFGSNFVKTMLRLAEDRPTLRVVADQTGNPTYAPHLADAVLTIATQILGGDGSEDRWGTYHAAATGETSWFGFAADIFARSGALGEKAPDLVPIAAAEYETAAARPADSRLDCTKLHSTFGIALPHWTEGVAAAVGRLLPNSAGALPAERRESQ